ncbi:MAG: radical SAM protein, partial [Deltaproteobacteria bacterium]|nr:radical SAM protein [Deltaproteobacteria bacterium]
GRLLLAERNLFFSVHRLSETGYLPPCALPEVWESRPDVFRATLGAEEEPNATFEACARCVLARPCAFRDRDAVAEERRAALRPVRDLTLPWVRRRAAHLPVPAAIVRRRDARDVVCTSPWTTMEVVDPDGRVRQCCSTWTRGARGNVFEGSLLSIWNGEGYRAARRLIADGPLDDLCLPICSRLHDRKFDERAFTIQRGSRPFVDNQLLMAEEIAERREVLRSKPLRLALCPSTYCNYDCIMCDHGRSPRRELPDHVWDELPELLPTLQTLTFLGGEPLAQQRVVKFLGELDAADAPDLSIDFVTNGSLLTPKVSARLARAPLGDVTISLNAGTPEVYERVQRGIALSQVHEHIDALVELRRTHVRWFGITLSFVVQPASSATLVAFAEFAHRRNLRIRLMALNPEQHVGLDFYGDPEVVAQVVRDVDALSAWSERVRPEWLPEIRAARMAVLGEAAARAGGAPPSVNQRRLPVVS